MLYLVYILAGAGAGVITGLAGLSAAVSYHTFTCQCMWMAKLWCCNSSTCSWCSC